MYVSQEKKSSCSLAYRDKTVCPHFKMCPSISEITEQGTVDHKVEGYKLLQ